jgi:hypothetical protein
MTQTAKLEGASGLCAADSEKMSSLGFESEGMESADEFASLSALLAEADTLEKSISSTIKSDVGVVSAKSASYSSTDNKSMINHRVHWSRSLHLEYILAMLFRPGTPYDGLEGIKTMSESDIEEVCSQFSLKVKDVVHNAITKLKSSPSTEVQSHSTEGADVSAGK